MDIFCKDCGGELESKDLLLKTVRAWGVEFSGHYCHPCLDAKIQKLREAYKPPKKKVVYCKHCWNSLNKDSYNCMIPMLPADLNYLGLKKIGEKEMAFAKAYGLKSPTIRLWKDSDLDFLNSSEEHGARMTSDGSDCWGKPHVHNFNNDCPFYSPNWKWFSRLISYLEQKFK